MVATAMPVGTEQGAQQSYGFRAWLVVFSAALFFFFEFIQLNMFNALDPALIKSFHISGASLGNLSGNYFYANVIFLFTAGMVLDRFSTRKVLLFAMSLSVLCTFLFSAATELWQAELCRFVTGIGGAFCLLSCVRLASRWFPPYRMALVIGLVVTFAMMGGMIAQTPLTILVDSVGWRSTLFWDAVMGLLMLVWIGFFVKDYPPGHRGDMAHQIDEVHKLGLWHTITRTVGNLQNWLGGLYTSLMNLPIFLFGAMWGGMYLVQVRGLTREDASIVTMMIFIGTIIGSPLMGWFSDSIRRRRLPMLLTGVISLLLVLTVMYSPHLSFASLIVLFFLLGFFTSAQIIGYPLIAESNPLALTGSAEGLASTLIMAGGFTQPLYGYLMEQHWSHRIVDGMPIYTADNFLSAMIIMPIGFVGALLAAFLVRETYCKGIKDVV